MLALKVVRKRDTRRKNQVERIKTEREVMAHAENPFVVRLYPSFQSREHLYLVMEVRATCMPAWMQVASRDRTCS